MKCLRKNFNSITLALSATIVPVLSQAQDAPMMPPSGYVPAEKTSDGYTLWKAELLDVVVAAKDCPETGVCGYIYWLNPKDRKVFDTFSEARARGDAGANTSDDDVKSFCGYRPRGQFKEVSFNRWVGTLELPGKKTTIKVDAETKDGRTMTVKISKGFLGKTETWHHIKEGDVRYPKCEPRNP